MSIQTIKRKCAPIFKRHTIKIAYLFGSHSRGTAGPMSDIDIAVYKKGMTEAEQTEVFNAISEALHTFDLDLINLENTPPLLFHRAVIFGMPLISSDRQLKAALVAHAIHGFEDHRYLFDIKQKHFLGISYI